MIPPRGRASGVDLAAAGYRRSPKDAGRQAASKCADTEPNTAHQTGIFTMRVCFNAEQIDELRAKTTPAGACYLTVVFEAIFSRPRNPISFFDSFVAWTISHSHRMSTRQPVAISDALCVLSRCLFLSIFRTQ
ncbi:MAG TPA: hypothetical protein VHY84_28530 [Bryobacteraceae bacterium]|nr:hypothetical protein [Bryobacteraceae bacterium]